MRSAGQARTRPGSGAWRPHQHQLDMLALQAIPGCMRHTGGTEMPCPCPESSRGSRRDAWRHCWPARPSRAVRPAGAGLGSRAGLGCQASALPSRCSGKRTRCLWRAPFCERAHGSRKAECRALAGEQGQLLKGGEHLDIYPEPWTLHPAGLLQLWLGSAPFCKRVHGRRKAERWVLAGEQGHLLKGGEQDCPGQVLVIRPDGRAQVAHVLLRQRWHLQ